MVGLPAVRNMTIAGARPRDSATEACSVSSVGGGSATKAVRARRRGNEQGCCRTVSEAQTRVRSGKQGGPERAFRTARRGAAHGGGECADKQRRGTGPHERWFGLSRPIARIRRAAFSLPRPSSGSERGTHARGATPATPPARAAAARPSRHVELGEVHIVQRARRRALGRRTFVPARAA